MKKLISFPFFLGSISGRDISFWSYHTKCLINDASIHTLRCPSLSSNRFSGFMSLMIRQNMNKTNLSCVLHWRDKVVTDLNYCLPILQRLVEERRYLNCCNFCPFEKKVFWDLITCRWWKESGGTQAQIQSRQHRRMKSGRRTYPNWNREYELHNWSKWVQLSSTNSFYMADIRL